MKRTRAIILANLTKHSHFEEYFKIIDIIEEHENVNPDICIESCKALVEGISKTIIINLDKARTIESIDDDDLPKVFKNAIKFLAEECEDMEGDFVSRFSGIIQVLGEMRNKRGDISHGRVAPKFIYSSARLASTVINMTESMLEYILEHYFSLDLSSKGRLAYESLEMEAFNLYLDESIDFPVKKAKYSKVLYDNDYDEYETRYSDEYLKSKENEEDVSLPDVEIADGEKDLEKPHVIKEPIEGGQGKLGAIKEVLQSEDSKILDMESPEASVKESERFYRRYFERKTEKPVIKNLVNTFYEESFWTKSRRDAVLLIASTNDFSVDSLIDLIGDYLFKEKPPLPDKVAKSYKKHLGLLERRKVLPELENKIVEWAQQLKNIKGEG